MKAYPKNPKYLVTELGDIIGPRGNALKAHISGTKTKYKNVGLHGGGARQVHAIVAETYLGPRPDGMEVRHLNGDSLDNRVCNLVYGTHADNMQDRVRHSGHPMSLRTQCPQGHSYTPENTRLYTYKGSVRRHCRSCARIRRRIAK